MNKNQPLEYLCPYCGVINAFELNSLRDMYHEQVETFFCCKKKLSLTAADGVEGQINLVITELENELQVK